MASQVLDAARQHVLVKYLQQFLQRHNSTFSAIGLITCLLLLNQWLTQIYIQLRGRGPIQATRLLYTSIRRHLFGLFLNLPAVRKKVDAQVSETVAKIGAKLVSTDAAVGRYTTLPKEGWDEETVLNEMQKLANMEHVRWEDGRVSGAVYHGGQELLDLQTKVYGEFTVANPIHPDVFPAVRKMEAEIVAMVLSLFNAPPEAGGACTSGGTESILAACLSARERGRIEKGIKRPEMILPSTAHPAFRKAGHYYGIKIHEVDCPAPAYRVDVRTVKGLINRNTVLIVGSAPNFPHGVIDCITELSRLAVKNDVLLHVDCCLGSFIVPMLEKAGFHSEKFDFRLPGVTSISCDTHKYGFAPKGTSTVLYRTKKLRSYQYSIYPDWSGGVYASQGMLGSRPGALIAGCWASMMKQGEAGYLEACREIVGCAKRIEKAIRSAPLSGHLQVVGEPQSSVVAFTSSTVNMWNLADELTRRGWHLNAMQDPPAIHVAVTMPIVKAEDQLLADLGEAVKLEAERLEKARLSGKAEEGTPGDSFALYGVAGSLPNKGVVVKLVNGYLDTMYQT